MREISMNLQGRIRNLPGSPTRVSVHTQTRTHHIANPGLSHENRPLSAHSVWHCSSTQPSPDIGLLCSSVLCCWTHSLELLRDEFTHLDPSRNPGLTAFSRGSVRASQLPYTDTRAPGSQQPDPSFVPEKQRIVMPVPVALTHREAISRGRSRASLCRPAGGLGSRSILPCQPRAAPPRHPAKYTPRQSPAPGLSSQLSANKHCVFILIHDQRCPVHWKSLAEVWINNNVSAPAKRETQSYEINIACFGLFWALQQGTAGVNSDKSKQPNFKVAGLPVFIEPCCSGTKRVLAIAALSRWIQGMSIHSKATQLWAAQSCSPELGMLT